MRTRSLVDRRANLAGTLVAIALAAWLLAGRAPQPAIVSDWTGDVAAAARGAAPEAARAAAAPAPAPVAPALVAAPVPAEQPWGNPFGSAPTVLTQDYGVGSHAPAATKGGIDLGLDPDGDGRGNPEATLGAPLYATLAGVVEVKANTHPAGNHIWIKQGAYKVGYAHLLAFAVADGQRVARGDLIGYAGSTGRSTGPHLHYHIWQDGVNRNPLHFGALP